MRSRMQVGVTFATLACVAALALPALVFGSGTGLPRGSTYAFRAHGSNGYSVLALPTVDEDDGFVQLIVGRDGSGVSYVAPATVTSTSIQADLGALGRIVLDFEPSGAQKTIESSCGGKPVSYEGGSWEGTFEFLGEEGYTEASVTRTPALVRPVLEVGCGGVGFGEETDPGLPGAALKLVSTAHRRDLRVEVHKNRSGAPVNLSATLDEARGEILIERSVEEAASSTAFSFDPMLRTASLALPTPFSGHASFQRTAGAPRWTGNLTIDFPGRSNVPLTGPKVHPTLVHAKFTQAPRG